MNQEPRIRRPQILLTASNYNVIAQTVRVMCESQGQLRVQISLFIELGESKPVPLVCKIIYEDKTFYEVYQLNEHMNVYV